jgi:PAS domain S-box-containing protein
MAAKILIVDDMPDAIEFLPDWLRHEGYEPVMATRGQQALALAEEIRPEVILMDVMMPGMDGIETCRRLRMNPVTADIPVILISARSPSEARAEGLLAGATDYITKPIHFADLLVRIERLLRLQEDMPPDHLRLLEETAYTTLTVLPCNLAWLLIVDGEKRWLVHQAIAMEHGGEAEHLFLSAVKGDQPEVRFPLVGSDNPLADVVLNRAPLINIPTAGIAEMAGGAILYQAFVQFRFPFISLLPLVTSGRAVGVLVLATMDAQIAESRRTQQILNSLSSQAAMVVDNARLLSHLAAREAQMRADQAFRQMVLDAMGEGLIVVDEEAKITYVNNRLLRMTGYDREALYGHSVGMIFHPDHRDQLVSSLSGQRRSTLPFSQKLYTKDGQVFPVLLSRALAHEPDGTRPSTVMVVTDLSELQRHEEALKLQTLRLQALNRAANAISSASTLQNVVRISLESALEVVQGVSASILLMGGENPKVLTTAAAAGPYAHDQKRVVTLDEGLVGWVASTAKSQLVKDVSQHEVVQTQYPAIYGVEPRSVIAVPLIAFDEVTGVLEVVNKTSGIFDEQDLGMLESMAGSAAIVIENARLFDETRRRVTELSTLLDASAAVTSTLDFGDILERIAHQLSLALHVERVLIMNWHRHSNTFETLAEVVNAYWPPGAGPVCSPEELPLIRAVLKSGNAMRIANPGQDSGGKLPSGLKVSAAFPIILDGRITGAVALYRETLESALPPARIEAVTDVVARWQTAIQQTQDGWWMRANLTDLCQRVLQASGFRWCNMLYWDPTNGAFRVLREIGRALWLSGTEPVWDAKQYPSMMRVLDQGEALTFQRDDLDHDPGEQTYLQRIGGNTCLVAPLLIRGESNGLVKLIDSKPERRVFDNAELSLCQGIANVVGNAMENAQLYTVQEQRASALEAAYKELQEADRLKDDLLQNLSHELRTPLTHILGYLRLMEEGAFGALNEQQIETLELVTTKAQQLTELINDIVSVQESEAHNLMPKPIHLERVVALAVRTSAPRAETKEIQIAARIPANLPPVYGDPVRLQEVFEELLENAIKFSPRATQIEIIIDDPGGLMIQACVRDHGIGIAPEQHEKIFRRFYQVDSGTTRHFGGTGLGLTIVRKVIEGHNGRVWVESEPGQGSCFYLTLPKASTIAAAG